MTYETCKNEIAVWQLVQDLKKEKQALVVSLSLTENARETAMELQASELGKENGMELLLSQLGKVFLCHDKDQAYDAYKNFDDF
jgi:hypothetical protein